MMHFASVVTCGNVWRVVRRRSRALGCWHLVLMTPGVVVGFDCLMINE